MRRVAIGSVIALTLMGSPAFGAACLQANQDGQVVEGRLERRRITNEAYKSTEIAYLLFLAKPVCLDGKVYDQVDTALRVHVFSLNNAIMKKLRANIGRTVRVTGNAFGEHTAHHHAPIVMNAVEITRAR